jgi:hypothetical protein
MRFFTHTTVRRIGVFLVACMTISALFAGAMSGAFGPTVEQTAQKSAPVDEADAILPLVALGAAALGAGAACYVSDCTVTQEDIDTIQTAESNQHKVDLHAGMQGKKDSAERSRVGFENFNEDSRTIASQKAKVRIVEMINNGTTDTTAIKNEVDRVIEEYYSLRQRNLVNESNAHVKQIHYSLAAIENDSGISQTWIAPPSGQREASADAHWGTYDHMDNATGNYTLIDGTNVTARQIHVQFTEQDGHHAGNHGENWGLGTDDQVLAAKKGQPTEYGYVNFDHIVTKEVSDPDVSSNLSVTTQYNKSEYEHTMSLLSNSASAMKSNYDSSTITAFASAYQAGTINTSDLVTPDMLASEWATKYNQTGDSTYKWAHLVALGLEVPDLANTSYVNMSYMKDVGTRHVTLDFTGTPSANTYTVGWLGAEAGTGQTTVNASELPGTVRVPAGHETTVTIDTASESTSFDSRPDEFTPYASEGNSTTIGGMTVTVEDPSPRDRRVDRGMIFARNASDGGFDVGTEYSVSNISTGVYYAPEGQNESIQKVVGNFTLLDAKKSDGTDLETIGVRRYNYQTANASVLSEQLQQGLEMREDIEAHEKSAVSSGGVFDLPFMPDSPTGKLVVALIAVAALGVVRDLL